MTWSSLAISLRPSIPLQAAAAVAAPVASHDVVNAGELRVLSAASIQEVFKDVLGDFEHASGHSIIVQYATMGAITERIRNGEPADLVISSRQSVATLLNEQRIEAGSQTSISRVGVGVVVAAGSPAPDIATVEDFRRSLAAANTIVYADPDR